MLSKDIIDIIEKRRQACLYLEIKDTSNAYSLLQDSCLSNKKLRVEHMLSTSRTDKILSKLEGIEQELIHRIDLFNTTGSKDITDHNSKVKDKIPCIVFTIEDISRFYNSYGFRYIDKSELSSDKIQIIEYLASIRRLGKIAGLTIVLICNYPCIYKEYFKEINLDKIVEFKLKTSQDRNSKNKLEQETLGGLTPKNSKELFKGRSLGIKLLLGTLIAGPIIALLAVTFLAGKTYERYIIHQQGLVITPAQQELSVNDMGGPLPIKTVGPRLDNILITAAHLGDIDGYILMYQDAQRDVAYYLKKDLNRTKIPEETEVVIEGLDNCIVDTSSEGEFIVSTSTPDKIVNGMSGKRVYDKTGSPIGFVDALVKDRKIKCITLE